VAYFFDAVYYINYEFVLKLYIIEWIWLVVFAKRNDLIKDQGTRDVRARKVFVPQEADLIFST